MSTGTAVSTSAATPTKQATKKGNQGPASAVCPPAEPGHFSCFSVRNTPAEQRKGVQPDAAVILGYGPADLQSAYNLPADGGAGQTVAIVDAYDDPTAEADLAVYRAQFGLPECTTANGCLTKVDQRGGTDYPAPDAGWAGEISLDLDMVSAIAPNAHILLVEADSNGMDDLGASVNEAVALGAKYVSNSYGSDYASGEGEDPSETAFDDAYYNHPGVVITASSGDDGHGTSYPAASPYVTSVGGTSLVPDSGTSRGWSESAWAGAGSGCSSVEPKPAFQEDTGCANRSISDVSAVADPVTGVAVYQTYGGRVAGWNSFGGTSASAPIIASVYAAAGAPVAGSYPNAYPYAAKAGLNDVTSGSNGTCSPDYLCTGATGYDGPTGLGTPDGLTAFRSGPHGQVTGTVTDTATGKPISGATITVDGNIAHTDAKGAYSVWALVGTYDVTVDAFGYASKSVKAVDVKDGATLTEDFALTAVASHTVSGKVTDGSGHGWPLYAKITVDGTPASVWTDPVTGEYSVDLPEGRDYTLRIAANNPGYKRVTKQVTVGTAAQSLDVQVPADPFGTIPDGYQVKTNGTTESFDATTAPDGWSVVNADGTVGGWTFDNPGGRVNATGGSGNFAIVDSDHYGGLAHQDSQLISPVYDFTGKSSPEVAFSTDYEGYSDQAAEVDYTTDGGTTWTKAWSTQTEYGFYHTRIDVPLDGAANKSAVQVRFKFTGNWGYWWGLDNVFIGSRDLTATPGGLVVGTVKDANTGAGTVGATVTDTAAKDVTATTVATPDDPNTGDGFYSLFTGSTGSTKLTAARSRYTDASQDVTVAADSAVRADFALKAGQLQITPDKVGASVAWGAAATQKVTVKNTGGAPATLKIGERQGGFQPQAKSTPLQRIKGDFTTTSNPVAAAQNKDAGAATASTTIVGAADGAWQTAPDFPQGTKDNAVGSYKGKIYSAFGWDGSQDSKSIYELDPGAGAWTKLADAPDAREATAHGFIDGKFYVASGWTANGVTASMDIYDTATDKWSTGASAPTAAGASASAVLGGKLYMIGGCTDGYCSGVAKAAAAYDPATDKWTSIAAYPKAVSFASCAGIEDKLYCAGGVSEGDEIADTYAYDPTADKWTQVADLPAPRWGAESAAANGQFLVVSGVSNNALDNKAYAFDPQAGGWSALPNVNVPSTRGGAATGFYKVGGVTQPGGAPIKSVEILPGYNQETSDVSWLSESTQQVTLAPGASTTVDVKLDASDAAINQPGAYTAQLFLASDTPYSLPTVPVTLTVAPPKTWGKITGTILGATASGGTTPLAGATVEIDGGVASYTLTTGTDGTYALWLDAANSPLTVTVAKDGYKPTTTSVKIKKGQTVTSDFNLARK
ncbi:carboxypeptidase regulatory-like domain-containing protein [Streptomyces sp. NPDC056227]|uniref:carboxypeptidase regulatory-like domain-containing protein n=1 Tax=Streptomyces sp. NPDC056227 TaxID=3345753 RepID=UPI0035D62582